MVAPRGPAMPTDAVASKGRQPHSGGGRGDGHRLGSWTVMPRAGPRIAHGPGTRTGVKAPIPRLDNSTVGDRPIDPAPAESTVRPLELPRRSSASGGDGEAETPPTPLR